MKRVVCFVLMLSLILVGVFAGAGQDSGGSTAAAVLPGGVPQRPAGYGNKPITIICPFAAGGAVDNGLRALQPVLQKMGVETIVTNITGGSGVTGALEAINANPDGYTVGTIGPGFFAAWAQGLLEFSLDDCTIITRSNMDTNGIFVKTDAPWKNAQELVDWIIANPGQFTVGQAGSSNTLSLIMTEALKDKLGGKEAINILGYEGASRAATEVIGGHILGATGKLADYINHINSGLMRPVMSTAAGPTPIYEGIQTFNELPYPDMFPVGDPVNNTTFIVASKRLKPEVAKYLQDIFRAAVTSEEYQAFAKKAGSMAVPTTPEESKIEAQKCYEYKYEEAVISGLIEK
jgi:tripartite-type tricarboxylate transporter receptor subunit TctC